MRVGDLLNTVARTAHAPEMSLRFNAADARFHSHIMRRAMMA